MRILGIDPGYDRLGIAVIEKPKKGRETLVYSDCLQTNSKDSIYVRLKQVGEEVSSIMDKFKPDAIALETLFITKNQKTAMRVAEARGIVIYEAVKRGIAVSEYSPMQIKMAVTSDGNSGKDRIFKMLPLLIDLPIRQLAEAVDDEYDAIAVALTHSACTRL